jgi:hypothetical protein
VAEKIDMMILDSINAIMVDFKVSRPDTIRVLTGPEAWSVEVHVRHTIPEAEVVDAVDDLLEALLSYAAAASAGRHTMTVRLTVEAQTFIGAAAEATQVVAGAFARIRRASQIRSIWGGEVMTMDELERRLNEPPLPEIIGVAELKEVLHVSKQRASYLAKGEGGFPKPFAMLASGPVWLKPTVLRFMETWPRKPQGRPKHSAERRAEGP